MSCGFVSQPDLNESLFKGIHSNLGLKIKRKRLQGTACQKAMEILTLCRKDL